MAITSGKSIRRTIAKHSFVAVWFIVENRYFPDAL
ncbi:MAG: hypothetical protein JSS49_12225 [Planctomycetes bacterium]|nr:hypothetical protein [Planctomycetota bacterium]